MLTTRIENQEVRITFCRKQPCILLLRLPAPQKEHVSVLPATSSEYLEDAYNLLTHPRSPVNLSYMFWISWLSISPLGEMYCWFYQSPSLSLLFLPFDITRPGPPRFPSPLTVFEWRRIVSVENLSCWIIFEFDRSSPSFQSLQASLRRRAAGPGARHVLVLTGGGKSVGA